MKWTKIGLYASIGLTGILILGFLGETIGIFGGEGSGYDADAKVYLLCVNPSCKAETEMTAEEYTKLLQEMTPGNNMMMPMMGPVALTCQKCNKKSAYVAEKCQKCGTIFIPNPQSGDEFPDKCPKCGFSLYEESTK